MALEDILRRHAVWRGGPPASFSEAILTGHEALDRELPGGGWPASALTEILLDRAGIGELQLLMPALARLSQTGRRIVWLSPPHLPYAPALAAWGIDLRRLALVRAAGRRDTLWAAEQVLRAGACHALLAWVRNPRYEELRRLAVGTEASRAMTVLFRPPQAGIEPSPARVRIALEAGDGTLAVRILKRRGSPLAAPLMLPLKRPFHALGRSSFSTPASGDAGADRRLGLPVHA
jgi:hypothetical protein